MLSLLTKENHNLFKMKMELIGDSYYRMATNRDSDYREEQMVKCDQWLEEMTKMLEE